jgi:hypothetical protein
VVARLEPWIGMAERKPRALPIGSVSASMVPSRDLAFVIIAPYLGSTRSASSTATVSRRPSLLDLEVRYASVVEAPPSSPRTEKR